MNGWTVRTGFRQRWAVAVAVLILHIVLIAALVRAFAPGVAGEALRTAMRAVTVTLDPSPPPPPAPRAAAASRAAPAAQGRSGEAGRKAVPREIAAPRAPIIILPTQAPPIAERGKADTAGAASGGEGTGAAGAGQGIGAGAAGSGAGGGGARPTVKIAGDISSAKDYPRATRDLRIGASVVIDLMVSENGRVTECRVVRPSPDSQADSVTCALATRRFRFRPAIDPNGRPVAAVYRWRQRWFN